MDKLKERSDIHLVLVSDCSTIGSGYATLTMPIATGLAELGYDVKILALEYHGEEHEFPLSMIPCGNGQHVVATMNNLVEKWGVDVLVVLLDIPAQIDMLSEFQNREFKYIGVFPVESDPMSFSWTMEVSQMDKQFVISEFGTQECKKVGVDAEHIVLGIDTESWRSPLPEERIAVRNSLGFTEDTFVVLTVADNQERKNLVRAMEIFADFKKDNPEVDAKYVMVTREHMSVGWRLRDYAQQLEINNDFIIFERGLNFKKLWSVYASADCFLLTSKAEGLGLPLLEAMACGVPCVATNCTAIQELLADGRGLLIDYLDDFDLRYIDPFGMGNRYFAKRSHGKEQLQKAYEGAIDVNKALEYVHFRTWEVPVKQVDNAIREIINE